MRFTPQLIAVGTGAVDGWVLQSWDRSNAEAAHLGTPPPPPYPLLYRVAVALTGWGLVMFTEVNAEVATALMVAGTFGLASMGGAAALVGKSALGLGWVAAADVVDGEQLEARVIDPYVTADGRFIQGPPDARDAPAFVAGLLTPPASLRGYGASQQPGGVG